MIFLALRYLVARRRQTLLTLLGIFFGTVAFISISGIMLGFREYIVGQLVSNSAHVHIRAREEFLLDHTLDQAFFGQQFMHVFWDPAPSGRKDSAMVANPQSWYRRLAADPRVAAYTPQLTASVIFSNGKATAPAVIIGCDPLQQRQVTTIGDYVIEGSFANLAAGGNRLAVGDDLKKKLGVRLFQNVLVSLANGQPAPFKVVAIFKTGIQVADSQAYGALGDVQRVNRTPNQVNEIAVKLHDYTQALGLAKAWSALGSETVESWDQINANIFNIFKIQDAIRFLSVGAVMVVAGFGIYNVLTMTVMQKRKDVAILRSMGYSAKDIVLLFFVQGLILGLSGATLGLLFGYALGLYLETIPFSGGPLGSGTGHMLISRNADIYIQAAFLAIASASIASILPALSAGRLTPIEIIRAGAE